MDNNYKPGDHNVHCMRCGRDYHESDMRKEWNGLIVCKRCWEPRHPQDFVRATKDKVAAEGLVTGRRTAQYTIPTCTTRSAIAGVAIAGCAIAGYSEPSVPAGTFGGGL